MKVLLIDDDQKLGELLKDYLEKHSIELHHVFSATQAPQEIQKFQPDLLLLDVMMPEKDGFTFCKELRAQGNTIPIIMLTARGETTDRVVGLEIGADDYLPKPFEPRELAARIQSVTRRSSHRPHGSASGLTFGELEIRANERNVFLSGKELNLTTAEYEALYLLASHPGKKITRDEIMNHLSGVDADVYSRSVDVLISRLRSKLGDVAKSPKYIKTAWGTGYVFLPKSESTTPKPMDEAP